MLAKRITATAGSTTRKTEITLSGRENWVWMGQRLSYGTLHFYSDSEGRIIRVLLAVLLTTVEGKMPQQLAILGTNSVV